MTVLIILGVLALGYFALRSKSSSTGANYSNISTVEARELLKDKNVVPLDVRTPAECSQGMIKGAKKLNVASPTFVKGLDKLDKEKTYLVYCRSGRRSIRACNMMSDSGFANLYNLKGGYNAWN